MRGLGKDREELVAAQAAHRVRGAHALHRAHAHLREELVARVVPPRVVHRLESIEVEHDQREAAAGAARALDLPVEAAGEERPVRQSREHVVVREALDALGGEALAALRAHVEPQQADEHQRGSREEP